MDVSTTEIRRNDVDTLDLTLTLSIQKPCAVLAVVEAVALEAVAQTVILRKNKTHTLTVT